MSTLLLDTADECARWLIRYGVTPRQIRKWADRGKITRYPGDRYNAREIADWYEYRRNARMVRLRVTDDCGTVTARDASPETG